MGDEEEEAPYQTVVYEESGEEVNWLKSAGKYV